MQSEGLHVNRFCLILIFFQILYFKYSIWQNHFFSICNGVLYFLSLLVLVVLVERGINFVCCSTRCFVAYDSWYRIYITPGHQSPTEPSLHHQICTRPMGFEHQSALQSSHPVISINEHHRINQYAKLTEILRKNRCSSEIGNFEKEFVFMEHDRRDI